MTMEPSIASMGLTNQWRALAKGLQPVGAVRSTPRPMGAHCLLQLASVKRVRNGCPC